MAKLRIRRELFDDARQRSVLNANETKAIKLLEGTGNGAISAPVQDFPMGFLRALLDDSRLTANQRAVVAMQVYGMRRGEVDHKTVYQTTVGSPVEFGSTFAFLGGHGPNCEVFLNGRWYPVKLGMQFLNDEDNRAKGLMLHTYVTMCETGYVLSHLVTSDLFVDESGQRHDRPVIEILEEFGYRPLQTSSTEFNLKLLRAERMAREAGTQVQVTGPVMSDGWGSWSKRFTSRGLGTPEAPRRAIVDAELEVNEDARNYHGGYYYQQQDSESRLPFVRVFSLDLKAYVYVDVDDIQPYEYDHDVMHRLHLPAEMISVLTRVFSTPVERLFGDLVHGKHGGVVILASGNPGVGKTMTAEVYAEQTNRPLYVLELGELGTNAQTVETSLRKIFTRVARWNAVLQFDECEIFLAQRGQDLERSAIVGIFLRLLDYYQGILFLTTNRTDVLDHAVRSRVMLKLEYPDLDAAARQVIWQHMFEAAGLELTDGHLSEVAERELNGRQIRNLTRLAAVLHPAGKLTLQQLRDVLSYECT
jgi:hypothetical protein